MKIGTHYVPARAALAREMEQAELDEIRAGRLGLQCRYCGVVPVVAVHARRDGSAACDECWIRHDHQARVGALVLGMLKDGATADEVVEAVRKAYPQPGRDTYFDPVLLRPGDVVMTPSGVQEYPAHVGDVIRVVSFRDLGGRQLYWKDGLGAWHRATEREYRSRQSGTWRIGTLNLEAAHAR